MIDPIASLFGETAGTFTAFSAFLRILFSLVFSAVIGCERSSKRHSAGLRTFMLFSFTGTVAMLLDLYLNCNGASHFYLVSAAMVIGSASISVNSILYSSKNQIKGLTTSAALFACGIVGLLWGAGLYTVGLISSLALLACLSLFPSLERYLKNRSNHFEIHLELKSSTQLQSFVKTIRELGLIIEDIESNPAYIASGLAVYSVAITITSAELKKYKSHKEIIEALSTLEYVSHIEEMK